MNRLPVLEPEMRPMILELEALERDARAMGSHEVAISVVRNDALTETMRFAALPDGVDDARNTALFERVAKTMLWVYGGWKIVVSGSKAIFDVLRDAYREGGARDFDRRFMEHQYECAFEVEYRASADDAPKTLRSASAVGRHLDGCRIGFDAGGSDRKVSAVIDGEVVYSEEVVWHPKLQEDPSYQYEGILDSLRTAASKMPRVDAVGVSSAGTFMNSRVMTSSLFIKVPKELYQARVKNIYLDVVRELGEDIPVVAVNDGDVTALAGAMDLNRNCVLGIAMGTSEAGGYVDANGNITGWLNELAFVPVDANPDSCVDEWSGDFGCGVKAFSQDAVIRLAERAGFAFDAGLSPAEKLKVVQNRMKEGDAEARKVYENIGTSFGYAIAYYSRFYDIGTVLMLGRVTSGEGGMVIMQKANELLSEQFPAVAQHVDLQIPDENSRRVGQSIAAASLPERRREALRI